MADKNIWQNYQTKLLGGSLLILGIIIIALLLSRHDHNETGSKQIEIAIQPQSAAISPVQPAISDSQAISATTPISAIKPAPTTIEVTQLNSKTNSNRPTFSAKSNLAQPTAPATISTPAQITAQASAMQPAATAPTNNMTKPVIAVASVASPQTKTLAAKPKSAVAKQITTAQTAPKPVAKNSPYTEAERRLLAVPKQHYAIQLGGANSYKNIENFIKTNGLQTKASYFQTYNKGKSWYVIIYGDFKTRAEAQVALKQLPKTVQAQHPWPRSYASIHEAIQRKLS